MTTPPTDKGKGKQLLYSRENSPRPSPIQRPRYTSSPPTAVIRPGDSTPSPISPNVANDFAITASVPLQRALSSESSKLREEIEPNPEPIAMIKSPTPPSPQAVRIEPAAPTTSEEGPRRLTPLDRYWTEDRRRRMFRAEPNPEPTKPRPIESPYERKFVKMRPPTPTSEEPVLSSTATPKPKSITMPLPTDTTPPSTESRTSVGKPLKRFLSPPPPRGPSPPRPLTPPSPPFRGPSPGAPPQRPNPIQGDDEPLQGREPFVFDGNRQKTDLFIHELRLYQFTNATHPIMMNPWQKVAHALTYVSGPSIYEWKRSAENWILSIPAPSALNRTIYEDFEEEFIESWTDTNEPYRAATDLDKLRVQHDDIDEYIARFTKLARKALYHENDPAVLEKFKSGLPLELLEPCMQYDGPQNWEAWTKSARTRQAILTSLKAHQTNATRRPPSPVRECTPARLSMPPPAPMEIDKMYTIPARRQTADPKNEEKRKGLCHLCKRHGHIQRHCPKKIPEQPARMANTRTTPLNAAQGIKRPRSPTMNGDDVLRYLKRTTPENRNEVAAELMKPATRQDFSLA